MSTEVLHVPRSLGAVDETTSRATDVNVPRAAARVCVGRNSGGPHGKRAIAVIIPTVEDVEVCSCESSEEGRMARWRRLKRRIGLETLCAGFVLS